MKKLLMHTCCAPCSTYVIKRLRDEGFMDITSYWYNINIHPYTEYKARLEALKQYTKMVQIPLVIDDDYGIKEFTKAVANNVDNRCCYCYSVRLEKAVKYAKEHGYEAFTTTLLVSPYQKHDLIIKIAEGLSQKYDIEFIYYDFRVGYRIGQQMAREAGIYMQKYCGCVYSEASRYLDVNQAKMNLPEGFKFLEPSPIEIKKIKEKEEYLKFLEEQEIQFKENLNDSEIYVLKKDNIIYSIAELMHINKEIIELKNIVTRKEYRNKGFAKNLLKALTGNYKQKYNKMIVKLSGEDIPFFIKQGFENYEKELSENLICYSKKLK